MNSAIDILGELSAKQFFNEYWQKKPLVIKKALPGFVSPLSSNELAGLSLESEVESRLVTGNSCENKWTLKHGPFDETTFKSLPDKDWTLLVQGVEQWVPEVARLVDFFNFLPRWRIDDVMVSYATFGGSVGPHFDYYDVFLLQGQGTRKWQIGQLCDDKTVLLKDPPLKILAEFEPVSEWQLSAGDMLYLPPGIAHYGVAISDDCISYSIGFRAPSGVELLNDLAIELMSRNDAPSIHLKDPDIDLSTVGNNLPQSYIKALKRLLLEILDDETLLESWFAEYMTRPKDSALAREDIEGFSKQQLREATNTNTLHQLIPGARVIKTRQGIYLNGEKL